MDTRAKIRYGKARLRAPRSPFRARVFRVAATVLACLVLICGTALAAPILKRGAEGHDVDVLQKNLRAIGYELELTGVFDEATYRAIIAFQRDEQLEATGAVNRETWKKLKQRAAEGTKPPARDAQNRGAKPTERNVPAEQAAPPKSKPAKRNVPAEQATPPKSEPTKRNVPAEQATPPKSEPPKGSGRSAGEETRARDGAKERNAPKEDRLPPAAPVPENAPFLPTAKAEAIIKAAKKHIGTRYQFGGTTPKGFDCSGFLQYVFKQNGFSIARTADEQYKLGKRIKKRAELVPGDLVFFSTYEPGASHCGIYLGKDRFIHVSSSRGVRVDSLDDEYWKPRWYGGKHIVKT